MRACVKDAWKESPFDLRCELGSLSREAKLDTNLHKGRQVQIG